MVASYIRKLSKAQIYLKFSEKGDEKMPYKLLFILEFIFLPTYCFYNLRRMSSVFYFSMPKTMPRICQLDVYDYICIYMYIYIHVNKQITSICNCNDTIVACLLKENSIFVIMPNGSLWPLINMEKKIGTEIFL